MMLIETQTKDNGRQCKISGALSIWEAGQIWQKLRPLFDVSEPVEIDFSAVSACDAAGIQILCQIRRMAVKRTCGMRIVGLSEAVRAAIGQAGMETHAFETTGGEN